MCVCKRDPFWGKKQKSNCPGESGKKQTNDANRFQNNQTLGNKYPKVSEQLFSQINSRKFDSFQIKTNMREREAKNSQNYRFKTLSLKENSFEIAKKCQQKILKRWMTNGRNGLTETGKERELQRRRKIKMKIKKRRRRRLKFSGSLWAQ